MSVSQISASTQNTTDVKGILFVVLTAMKTTLQKFSSNFPEAVFLLTLDNAQKSKNPKTIIQTKSNTTVFCNLAEQTLCI